VAEHRFDPIAFVFGGLALAAGTIVLTGGELTSEGRVLLPLGLITLGIAVLLSVLRRDPRVAAAFDTTADPSDDDGRSDLDDLFAPVDDVLTHWPPDSAPRPAGTDAGGDTLADTGVAAEADVGAGATSSDDETVADDTVTNDTVTDDTVTGDTVTGETSTDDTTTDDTVTNETSDDDTVTDDTRPGDGPH
jgi:hypothetical protein